MTYSIIARCPRTGRFGVGSTTFSVACGRRNESVRPNVGISKSQGFFLDTTAFAKDPATGNALAVVGGLPAELAIRADVTLPGFSATGM